MESGVTSSGAVSRAVDGLRAMLMSMQIMPGQPIRQEALAARLGISRAPIREALGILKSEGVLDYERNVGYTVKRLTKAELEQAYRIRRVLETDIVLDLPTPSPEMLDELERLNQQIADAGAVNDLAAVRTLNHEFHFLLYSSSGLDLIVGELRRMWAFTDAYRSLYLYDQSARARTVHEHAGIIDALRAGDLSLTATLLDAHRAKVPEYLAPFLDAQAATGL